MTSVELTGYPGLSASIRDVRKSKKITLRDIESKTNISVALLSNLETGITKKPKPQQVISVLRAIGASDDEMLKIFRSCVLPREFYKKGGIINGVIPV